MLIAVSVDSVHQVRLCEWVSDLHNTVAVSDVHGILTKRL